MHGANFQSTGGSTYRVGSGQAEIQIPITSDYYLDLQTCAL